MRAWSGGLQDFQASLGCAICCLVHVKMIPIVPFHLACCVSGSKAMSFDTFEPLGQDFMLKT